MPPTSETTPEKIEQDNVCLVRGNGSWVYDKHDHSYLYATTAVPTLGVSNPDILSPLFEQYKTLSFSSTCGQTHEHLLPLSEKLMEITDHRFEKVFFSNDGSGAIETALKLVRQYYQLKGQPEKTKFISFDGNYHGTTLATGAVTHMGIQESFGPSLDGCIKVPTPDLYRPPVQGTEDELVTYCLNELEDKIVKENPATIAALLIEPIQGVNGIIVQPSTFFPALRNLATKYDIQLIADEVTTGIGRMGTWTASEAYGIDPDLLVLSKGLTGGYFPMGATLFSKSISEVIFGNGNVFLHGSTQCGHPVACTAALTILRLIESQNILDNVVTEGSHILNSFRESLKNHPNVGDIRGKGLMMAIEFVEDKETKEKTSFDFGARLSKLLHRYGILGNYFNSILVLYPPLNISRDESIYLIENVVAAINQLKVEGTV